MTDATDPTSAPTAPSTPTAAPADGTAAGTTAAGTTTAATAAVAATPTLPRRRPLFPTMLWGALMLALAAFIAARELVPGGLDLVTWLLTAIVGIGLLLVVAGIAAASRRAG
jgi:hypothetical protein